MQNFRTKHTSNRPHMSTLKTKMELLTSQKIKFNITKDNLSCFIDDQRKRRVYSKVQNKKSTLSKNKNTSVSRRSKGKQEKGSKNRVKRTVAQSPDIVLEVSNEILNQIQDEGILCKWKDNQCQQKSIRDSRIKSTTFQNNVEKQFTDLQNKSLWGECPLALTLRDSHSKSRHSFASTADYFTYQISYEYYQPMPILTSNPSMCFQVNMDMIGRDLRTTLMIRNVPNKYTIKDISEQIDMGHANTYDFLYLPYDQKNCCNMGYGFINFVNSEYLKQFYLSFNNTRWLKFRSEKICCLTYARLQGLNSLIEHFENSKVLNQRDKKFRPIIKKFSNSKTIEDLVKQQQYRTCG